MSKGKEKIKEKKYEKVIEWEKEPDYGMVGVGIFLFFNSILNVGLLSKDFISEGVLILVLMVFGFLNGVMGFIVMCSSFGYGKKTYLREIK